MKSGRSDEEVLDLIVPGNLEMVTDARENSWSYDYDDADRVELRTDPNTETDSYLYDEVGNLRFHTDRRGFVTEFRYDDLNRMVLAGFDEDLGTFDSTIAYDYDEVGRLDDLTDSESGAIDFVYDDLDRPLSEDGPTGTVSWLWDDAGRMESMTVAGGPTTTYDWDEAGRPLSQARDGVTVTYGLDEVGRVEDITGYQDVMAEYGFDGGSALTGIEYSQDSAPLADLGYSLDGAGRVASMSGSLAGVVVPEGLGVGVYDPGNRVESWDAAPLVWDEAGNLLDDGTLTYSWDGRGRLGSVSDGVDVWSYVYDGLGRRVGIEGGADPVEVVFDGADPVSRMVGASESVTVSGPGVDFHLGLVVGEDPYSFLTDRLGTTLGLVDDGGIAATWQVGAFGETVQTGGDPLTPTAWAGLDQDPAGIYQVRARYYHPGLSRFVSEDPLGLAGGGVNLYVYAGGDPVNHTDPTGLSPDGLVDLIFIALDLHNLFTGGRKDLGENLAALGLDVLGLMIPIVTGLGAAGRHLDDVDDIGRALRGTDNIDDVFKGVCSFSGETEVLMGDGTAKPISEVEIGDQVRSYDPATGTETNETVTAVWVHDDTFVVLETEAGAVTTTDDHPFGTTDRNWTQADDLATGDLLVAAGGDQVGVTAPAEPTGQTGPAYNLTVSQTHTYYIVVGDQAVLVHNTCGWRGIGRTDEESQILHHERHGAGRTFEQYINDSYDWQRTIPDPRSGELTRLNDRTQGYRHRDPAGGPGGILDGNGCIITFWYDSRC